MTSSPQHTDFAPHLNKQFRFEGHHHALRLAAVDVSVRPHAPELTRKPFTLIFHGPKQEVMPEGMYAVEVENGPRFELYVMPILTREPDRQDYQAVFN